MWYWWVGIPSYRNICIFSYFHKNLKKYFYVKRNYICVYIYPELLPV